MQRKVSLIMPVYNAEKFIRDAIESVRKQTFSDFELLLIDDGSTDASGEICDRFAQSDDRIRVVHKGNGGLCAARNQGLRMAHGEYIGFMDNDDILLPETLEENLALMEKHHADWVKFGKTEVMVRDGVEISRKNTDFPQKVYAGEEIRKNLLALREKNCMTFVWDAFFKRELIEREQLSFDETFRLGNEDIDFCEQYAGISQKLAVNPKCYYIHYTRLGVSASSKYSPEKIASYLYLLKKSNFRYERYGLDGREQDGFYNIIVTKQILVNICQKLNDAGDLLSSEEKKQILRKVKNAPELARYCGCRTDDLKPNKKLYLYRKLFMEEKFGQLLWMDKNSRKLVYGLRNLKSGKRG